MATGRCTRGLRPGRSAHVPGNAREPGCGGPALVIIVSTAPVMVEHLRTHATVKHRLPT
jgi:hypothetical protein